MADGLYFVRVAQNEDLGRVECHEKPVSFRTKNRSQGSDSIPRRSAGEFQKSRLPRAVWLSRLVLARLLASRPFGWLRRSQKGFVMLWTVSNETNAPETTRREAMASVALALFEI